MIRNATVLILALTISGLLALAGAGDAAAQGRAASVKVDRVIREPLSQTMPVIGRFVARQTGIVAALVRGPVAAVTVEIGDKVKKGDVVARITTDRIRWNQQLKAAQLKERQAALKTAKAQFSLTQQELNRLASLRKSVAFSQARFEDKRNEAAKYQSEVGEKEAAVASARAELRLAEIDLYNAKIRAPYDGTVSQKFTIAGAYLNVGDPVVALINDTDLEIEADVPSGQTEGLDPGRMVAIRFDDGARENAVVRALVPEENALTRTRPVRFTPAFGAATAARRKLATNQSVTVLVPIGETQEVVSVHKDAVIPRGGQNIVFMAVDGKAKRRVVRLGRAVGGRFEVLGGLKPGDIVVIRGNERLRPEQPITYPGMPKRKPATGSGEAKTEKSGSS